MINLNLDPTHTAICSLDAFIDALTPELDYQSTKEYLIQSINLEKLAVSLDPTLEDYLYFFRNMYLISGMCLEGMQHYASVQNLYDHLCKTNARTVETADIPF